MTPAEPAVWRLRTRSVSNRDHTLIMGVLNVTPDSFSDGGAFGPSGEIDHERAAARGIELHEQGADIVDVGGESTRPGSMAVDAATELARVEPVVRALAGAGVTVSIDTSKPEVAAACLEAGAEIVNDVTALRDPEMARICADSRAGVVLMHMKGEPRTMQANPRYGDVVAEVAAALRAAAERAGDAGVDEASICVDPGIGFGKTFAHNLALLGSLDRIGGRYPVLVGASRKAFLGKILDAAGHPAPPERRDPATGATVALAVARGVLCVRVHDVAGGLQSARTADAIVRSSSP